MFLLLRTAFWAAAFWASCESVVSGSEFKTLGEPDPDLPKGDPERPNRELITCIWNYEKIARPRVKTARIAHGPDVRMIRPCSNREIVTFYSVATQHVSVTCPMVVRWSTRGKWPRTSHHAPPSSMIERRNDFHRTKSNGSGGSHLTHPLISRLSVADNKRIGQRCRVF
jgi:hypothetical protein